MLDGAGSSTFLDLIDERSQADNSNKSIQEVKKFKELKSENGSKELPFTNVPRDQLKRKQIVFIDKQVPDYEKLAKSFRKNVEIHFIETNEDGFKKIEQTLENGKKYSAIHIIGHGSAGQILFGNALLTNESIESYKSTLGSIGESLTKKGDILLRIDKRDYELNLTNAESNLYQAKVNLEREIAESQIAKDQWIRNREGTPSDLALRKPQLAQAQALLKAAEANFEIAQRNLSRTSLKAPFDGRIKNKFVDVGAVISPGVPLAQIYSTDKIEIYLPIAEQDLEFLDINLDGNPIPNEKRPNLVLYNDYGGKKFYWEGQIVRSTAEIDPQTRMISLIGEINNPFEGSYSDNPLKIGMFLNAIIDGKKFNDVVRVPRYAVRDDKIWVVNQEGILTSKKVTVLRYEQGQALIISGLDNGDEILLTKLSAPVDGMRLNVY